MSYLKYSVLEKIILLSKKTAIIKLILIEVKKAQRINKSNYYFNEPFNEFQIFFFSCSNSGYYKYMNKKRIYFTIM